MKCILYTARLYGETQQKSDSYCVGTEALEVNVSAEISAARKLLQGQNGKNRKGDGML